MTKFNPFQAKGLDTISSHLFIVFQAARIADLLFYSCRPPCAFRILCVSVWLGVPECARACVRTHESVRFCTRLCLHILSKTKRTVTMRVSLCPRKTPMLLLLLLLLTREFSVLFSKPSPRDRWNTRPGPASKGERYQGGQAALSTHRDVKDSHTLNRVGSKPECTKSVRVCVRVCVCLCACACACACACTRARVHACSHVT